MGTLISVDVDREAGVKGYLVIDTMVNGRCYGGLRMAPDLSPDSLARVARVKTLKYGFVGLPMGGASAGIAADPEMPLDRKRQLLKRFGEALEPYLRTKGYIPAEDLGTTQEDVMFLLESIGLKPMPRSLSFKLSGFYTGITVFAAAAAAAKYTGLDLSRATVAIEGFGNVGTSVARSFWKSGTRVVAISTSRGAVYAKEGLDIDELINLYHQAGSRAVELYPKGEQIDKGRLAELDVDIFSPCAQSYSINSDNANRLRATIISPGANAPITDEAEQILFQRGVVSLPDFVANCGGVLGVSMRRTGLKEDHIRRFLRQKIERKVTEVIESAEKVSVTPREYAERIAEDRFLMAKAGAEKKNIASRVFSFAIELYRRGVIPYQLVTPFASGYFDNKLR